MEAVTSFLAWTDGCKIIHVILPELKSTFWYIPICLSDQGLPFFLLFFT